MMGRVDDWVESLRDDLRAEFGHRPPTGTLATVRWRDGEASAAARTVVVRDVDPSGAMLIASDGRSEKNAEVRRSPAATLVFWCASVKRQYRVSGTVDLPGEVRQRTWEAMSDRARALFGWPPPGEPREDVVFVQEIPAESPMPACFEVLRLVPVEVETLDLNSHPHERVRWTLADGRWRAERVNP